MKAILEFLYPTGDSVRQALAADTAQQLKEIGIDASIRGTGWDTAYDEAQSQPLLWGWARTRRWNFIIFTIQRQIRAGRIFAVCE